MENNNENNTEIITENTIGTFLTLLLIWSRSFKIRSSLNAGFFYFDVAQGLRHPAHVAYPCVCACHLISICTLATAHLSQVCRGQGPVPCWNTDGVLTLAKPFRTLVCKWARARGRGPSVSAPWECKSKVHPLSLHSHVNRWALPHRRWRWSTSQFSFFSIGSIYSFSARHKKVDLPFALYPWALVCGGLYRES